MAGFDECTLLANFIQLNCSQAHFNALEVIAAAASRFTHAPLIDNIIRGVQVTVARIYNAHFI